MAGFFVSLFVSAGHFHARLYWIWGRFEPCSVHHFHVCASPCQLMPTSGLRLAMRSVAVSRSSGIGSAASNSFLRQAKVATGSRKP